MATHEDLNELMDRWQQAATIHRKMAERHHQRGRDHTAVAVFIGRASELEHCVNQLRELIGGPTTALCRCRQQIMQTPVGTWKHTKPVPMVMQNHIAWPAVGTC